MFRITCLVLVFTITPLAGAAEPVPVDFSRDVLPVLSDYCFQCHGPDANSRKAKLRFDDKNSPFDRGVIVAGKPKESTLIERVTSTDPELVMPPPSLKRKLSAQQIDALTRWVEQGAKWSTHWAFDPMTKPDVPTRLKNRQWVRNSIDAFVLSRLEREGLPPAAPADRERLLRRVTFDLTGLPPTIAEIDAFLKDDAANAYEKVVDRLLASPRYGERMAGEWLDLARFADTHGYQMDRARCGRTAIGSSPRTTATCRSTTSPPGNSPATCSPTPRRSNAWRPRSTACTCRTRRAGSSKKSSAWLT
jgi:hypothetical protein